MYNLLIYLLKNKNIFWFKKFSNPERQPADPINGKNNIYYKTHRAPAFKNFSVHCQRRDAIRKDNRFFLKKRKKRLNN